MSHDVRPRRLPPRRELRSHREVDWPSDYAPAYPARCRSAALPGVPLGAHAPREGQADGRAPGWGRLHAFLVSPVGLWLRRRLALGEVYRFAFTIGLLFTGLFSWAFGGIVEDLLSQDPFVNVDLAVLRFIYFHGDPTLTTGITIFEAVFSPEVLLLIGAVTGGVLLLLDWKRREPDGIFSGVVLLAVAFGTGALIEFFKILFDRPRPPATLQLVPEIGLGFPSGHAMAMLVMGIAALYLWNLRSPGR